MVVAFKYLIDTFAALATSTASAPNLTCTDQPVVYTLSFVFHYITLGMIAI